MSQLGYFGKTPHRGDFVRFNLPQSFITVWDDWLQQIMINGENSSEAWPQLYANTPTYRFALSGGIAGRTPWLGVLRASQDKVGRRFPFCLAMSLPENALPCASAVTYHRFYEDAENLLNRVLASDYEFDDLQDELSQLTEKHNPVADESPYLQTAVSEPSTDAITISMTASITSSNSETPALLDAILQQTLGEYSLWVANGNPENTVVNSGLPMGSAGLALVHSNWSDVATAFVDSCAPTTTSSDTARQPKLPNNMAQNLAQNETQDITQDRPPDMRPGAISTQANGQNEAPESVNLPPLPANDNQSSTDSVESVIIEQPPSADDWAALDDFSDTTEPSKKTIVPKIEPLELEEDDAQTAPWEE